MADETADGALPPCVVLDTNQWRSQYGLRSKLGASLLFLVRQHEGRLGVPEVIESEIVQHLVDEGKRAVLEVDRQFRVLQAITGSHPSVSLPADEDLAKSVSARLAELDSLIVRVPISAEHTRSALDRVNKKRSPNRKKEQFKDSLIWEATLSLSTDYRVHLVTEDYAFFSSDGSELAEDLMNECAARGADISLYRGARALLPVLQGTAPILDHSAIAEQIKAHLESYLGETAGRDEFTVGDLVDSTVAAFATEDHNRLFLAYELTGALEVDRAGTSKHEPGGRFVVTGEGAYDLNEQRVIEAKPGRCQIMSYSESGESKVSQSIVLGGGTAYLGGEPPKRLTIREPLPRGGTS